MKKYFIYITTGMLLLGLSSCSDDFFQENPESYISPKQLSSSKSASMASLKGIYGDLRSYGIAGYGGHEDYGHKSMLVNAELMGNDVVMRSLNWHGFYYMYTGRKTTHSRSSLPWFTYYIQIKNANTLINTIEPSETGTPKYIRSQALALRGYFHFMLARFYAKTYKGNESAKCIPINTGEITKDRKTNQEVYTQIVKDLQDAIVGLDGYVRDSKEFVDKSVAQAFLAEVYLEMGEYSKAADMANKARQNYPLLTKEEWKKGFGIIQQSEVMWGADINSELSSTWASFFSHFDNLGGGYASGGIAIDKRLYEAIPDTDYRKEEFVGSTEVSKNDANGAVMTLKPYTSLKFKDSDRPFASDYVYVRSALMYYIEAEGLARSGNVAGAQQVLFDITSTRDTGYTKSTKTGDDLIEEIILQKRIELWGEGYSFFDMKRLHKPLERDYTDSNHGDFGKFNKPSDSDEFVIQIPQKEMDATNMEQNP